MELLGLTLTLLHGFDIEYVWLFFFSLFSSRSAVKIEGFLRLLKPRDVPDMLSDRRSDAGEAIRHSDSLAGNRGIQ